MDLLACPSCGLLVFFDNTACLRCGTGLAFDPAAMAFVAVDETVRRCANHHLASCNWAADPGNDLCLSCRLTRTRPADDDLDALDAFATAEAAKRRLVIQLLSLGLPVRPRDPDTGEGVAFDLLSSTQVPVTTGHAAGLITLDLAESDDAHREAVRTQLQEPYRTVLGHFRHEIGHHYFAVLVGADRIDAARGLFGDETADYEAALQRHYDQGPPAGWRDAHISEYATMHPAEDWAETFAHYLHIRATLHTAGAYGLRVDAAHSTQAAPDDLATDATAVDTSDLQAIVAAWLPLSYALNAVNRSMGESDLYPFVLPAPVIAKLAFVHDAIAATAQDPR